MPTGLKDSDNSQSAIQFYTEWHKYLDPTTSIIAKIINFLLGHLLQFVYGLTSSTEKVFMATFKFIGLTDTFSDKGSVAYKFFVDFQTLGKGIVVLAILFLTITNIVHAKVKYKNALTNILMVMLVTAVLPWGISTIGGAINSLVSGSQKISGSKQPQSLAAQPITDNTVDLIKIAKGGFSVKLNKEGTLTNQKGDGSVFNDLTSSGNGANSISNIDFGQTITTADTDMISSLNKYKKGSGDIFTHQLYASKVDTKGNVVDDVTKIGSHGILKGLNAFEPVYTRYQVSWIPAFVQLLILAFLFITLAMRVIKSIFDIIVMGIISPYVGLVNIHSSRKYKELLTSMAGAFASMELEIVVIRIMMLIMNYIPTVVGKAGDLSIGEQGLLNIVVYLGAFYGCFSGVGYIERYTGVAQGHGDEAQQIAATAGLGMAAGAMGGSFSSGVRGAGQWLTGHGGNSGSVTGRAGGNSIGAGSPGMVGKGISAVGAVGEIASHPVQSVKAGAAGIKNGVKSGANGIANKFESGQNSVKSHFNNPINGSSTGTGTSNDASTETPGAGTNDTNVDGRNGQTMTGKNGSNGAGEAGIAADGVNGESGANGVTQTAQDGQNASGIIGESGQNSEPGTSGLPGQDQSGVDGHDGEDGQSNVTPNSHDTDNGSSIVGNGTNGTASAGLSGQRQNSTPQTNATNSAGLNKASTKAQSSGNAYRPQPKHSSSGITGRQPGHQANQDVKKSPRIKPNTSKQTTGTTKNGNGIKSDNHLNQQTRPRSNSYPRAKQTFNRSEQKFAAGRQELSQSMQRMTQSSQRDHVTGRDFEDDDDDQ